MHTGNICPAQISRLTQEKIKRRKKNTLSPRVKEGMMRMGEKRKRGTWNEGVGNTEREGKMREGGQKMIGLNKYVDIDRLIDRKRNENRYREKEEYVGR